MDVGGVGYLVQIPLTTYERLPSEGSEVTVLVTLVVREDSHRLFGFATSDERSFFTSLQTVSGVGPALALSIVSSITLAEFRRAVLAGDAARLRKVRGIGKKLSDRLVVEMKDVLERIVPAGGEDPGDGMARDALMALEALGFNRAEAGDAIRLCREQDPSARDAGELVRLALRRL